MTMLKPLVDTKPFMSYASCSHNEMLAALRYLSPKTVPIKKICSFLGMNNFM